MTVADVVIDAPRGTPRPPFRFSADDETLLDETQRGAFLFLWHEASPKTGMVRDRSSTPIVSIAGVGFQLSAIPVAIERGWITREQGHKRTKLILDSLLANPDNRKAGLFYHFLDPDTAGPASGAYEHTVSTIDSALLFAGIITAGEYFGGDIDDHAERLFTDADWSFFVLRESDKPYEIGFISLGWQPTHKDRPTGDGRLLPYVWADAGDEHRLVTFLAVAAPDPSHRVDPALYYTLRRQLGDAGPALDDMSKSSSHSTTIVWFPWSGALFTNFFAHCWINYASMQPDNPIAFDKEHRARVDWWENSRRAAHMHRRKCAENPKGLPTLSDRAWGLSASDVDGGYAVPGVFPSMLPMPGARPEFDFSTFKVKDDFGNGTIAPYAAGSTIMFGPGQALEALRYYRSLTKPDGTPLVWRDPNPQTRSYGFQDSFNLGSNWCAPDCVAIDQGPLLLAIENARTGRVWSWFESNKAVIAGYERLGFKRRTR